jgi:anti-anti-sigma factor
MGTDTKAGPGSVRARRSPNPAPGVSVVQHRSGPWTIVAVVGEMDIQVIDLMPVLSEGEAGRMVFDLRRVTFMDAAGFSAIMRYQGKARDARGHTRLVAPSTSVRRILTMTGTTQMFATFGSVHAALSAPL